VLEVQLATLGDDHPETLRTRGWLARIVFLVGRHDDAERETRSVLGIQSRILGPDHPDTLESRRNLGVL